MVFRRPFVKRFTLCCQTVVCPVLSCLSVTLVYCGQTVGWIKTKLGTQVGLASGQIVLYGNPAPLPQRDTHPNFWSISVVANGWSDQDATWYGGRPLPRSHCAGQGASPLHRKGGTAPNSRPMSIVAKRLDGSKMPLGIMKIGLRPGHIVLDGDPDTPAPKKNRAPFSAHVCCGQMAEWIKMLMGTKVGRGPGHILCYMGIQLPSKNGHSPTVFGPCLLWPNCRPSHLLLSAC